MKKGKAALNVIDKDTAIDTIEKPKPKKPDQSKRYETPWDGWGWIYGMYLIDPDGNRYTQEMIRSSIFAIQLQRELVGTENRIWSLKKHLEKQLNTPSPEIVIRWNGEETVIPVNLAMYKK
ncbi:MAG: hypothetical protein RLZZ215_2249 [Pseudomonadota bacterium]